MCDLRIDIDFRFNLINLDCLELIGAFDSFAIDFQSLLIILVFFLGICTSTVKRASATPAYAS